MSDHRRWVTLKGAWKALHGWPAKPPHPKNRVWGDREATLHRMLHNWLRSPAGAPMLLPADFAAEVAGQATGPARDALLEAILAAQGEGL